MNLAHCLAHTPFITMSKNTVLLEIELDCQKADPRDPMSDGYLDLVEFRVAGDRVDLDHQDERALEACLRAIWAKTQTAKEKCCQG